jgi:lipoate-protein ligase A
VQSPPIFPGRLRKNDDIFLYGAAQKKPFVHVYEQRDVEVVHGPSYCADREVFVDVCERDGTAIVERRGGGGTVVLSPGVLVILAVGGRDGAREGALDIFGRVHDIIIDALRSLGVDDAVRTGVSDLAVRGQKILGSSLYMGTRPPLFYYQSSLMVYNDLTLLDRYLRHPPREPDYRRGRGHGQFCATLRELGYSVDMAELAELIQSHLRDNLV